MHEPQKAARDLGKVGIGYHSDMMYTVGDSVLTSVECSAVHQRVVRMSGSYFARGFRYN